MIGSFLLPGDVELAARPRQAGVTLADRLTAAARPDSRAQPARGHATVQRMRFLAQRFVVRPGERAFLYKDGYFVGILEPGAHRFLDARRRYALERFELNAAAFVHPLLDRLAETAPQDIERCFERVTAGAAEVAIVYRGDRAADIVAPSQQKLYWRAYGTARIERLPIADSLTVDARVRAQLTDLAARCRDALCVRVVPDGHEGVLLVDGEIKDTLPPGMHAFWRFGRCVEVELVDLRVQSVDIDDQRLLTRDRVSVRVNATVSYRLETGAQAGRRARDARSLLCTEARVQLRSAVGACGLEALLTDGAAVEHTAAAATAARLAEFGIEVRRVGIREVVLSRELRRLLDGTYAVERQVLGLRVRELQAVERLTRNVSSLTLYGGLDWLPHGALRLKL